MLTSPQDTRVTIWPLPGFSIEEKRMVDNVGFPTPVKFHFENKSQSLTTAHPHIEMAQMAGGLRAMIRGTRIPVSVVAGYLSQGETSQTIFEEILPHLTRDQVDDAVLYYREHQVEIDRERSENTEQAARKQLRDALGDDGYRVITGG